MAVPADHPAVRRFHEHQADRSSAPTEVDANWLRQVCLEAGADDVGLVEIDRAELADQRADILAVLPRAQALISIVCRMNRGAIRTPARSVSNLEFHLTGDRVDSTPPITLPLQVKRTAQRRSSYAIRRFRCKTAIRAHRTCI